jgi:ketosteroid isomerase-like protein
MSMLSMSAEENIEVVRKIFRAIEERDAERLLELFDPEVEFHWPPSLPYAANVYGRPGEGLTWAETWLPLQPTDVERRMDPRVIAASDEEVVVLWRQRGVTAAGERFDGPVLGLYRLREGKLARAQMFYFDSAELSRFLARTDM